MPATSKKRKPRKGKSAAAPSARAELDLALETRDDLIRDRVVGIATPRIADLVAHPDNWRTHPAEQRAEMLEALERLGFVGALVGRSLPDGRIELLDGHLRAELVGQTMVPVLLVDLDDAEARRFVATCDALTRMAVDDATRRGELVAGLDWTPARLLGLVPRGALDDPDLGVLPPPRPEAGTSSDREEPEPRATIRPLDPEADAACDCDPRGELLEDEGRAYQTGADSWAVVLELEPPLFDRLTLFLSRWDTPEAALLELVDRYERAVRDVTQ